MNQSTNTTPEVTDAFAVYLSRAKRIALIAGAIGAAVGLGLTAIYLSQADKPNLRGAFGMPVVGGMGAWGLVIGFVLLFAPDTFFSSAQGQAYMQQIGTRSIIGARIVIVIMLVIGLAMMGLLGFLATQMLTGSP